MASQRSPNSFGYWLRQLRLGRGVGQAELARKCGLPAPYLSAVERDRRPPPRSGTMEKIASGLELGYADRADALAKAQRARGAWEVARQTDAATADEPPLDGLASDELAVLYRLVREASRSAKHTGRTVEVSFKHFRYVIGGDADGFAGQQPAFDVSTVNR